MIKINGIDMVWEENLTIDLLLKKCKYTFPLIMVKINGKHVHKGKYKETLIRDNDYIQVFHLTAGG